MHRGHHRVLDADGVVEDLDHQSQYVRRRAGAGDHAIFRGEVLGVDAVHDRAVDLVDGGRRQDDALGAGVEMTLQVGAVPVDPGRFDDDVGPVGLPGHLVGARPA